MMLNASTNQLFVQFFLHLQQKKKKQKKNLRDHLCKYLIA